MSQPDRWWLIRYRPPNAEVIDIVGTPEPLHEQHAQSMTDAERWPGFQTTFRWHPSYPERLGFSLIWATVGVCKEISEAAARALAESIYGLG